MSLLDLRDVSVVLGGARTLSGVSLRVEPGEAVALLGANGAGKTTLIRAALGLLRPQSGSVRLGGENPALMAARARALRAAYLPQRPQSTWPVPVESLVALGRFAHGATPQRLSPQDRAAVDAAIEACGLTALRHRPVDRISGGEKMRVHIARTLAQGAPLLMLDEPTAGLDPAQAIEISAILLAHAGRGGGIVFATHDIAFAARTADRILVLRAGAVLSEGAPNEALTAETLEAAYGRKGRAGRLGDAFVAVFD